ncbi:MAG: DinB family protein [Pleurocapsa sp. SU_196_0]|nr:DinB family protein [Pleurocapsa sp. SU_196_0]
MFLYTWVHASRPWTPNTDEFFAYYGRYIALVPDGGEVVSHLESNFERTFAALSALTPEQSRFRYAPDKWSVRQVVGHLSDAERVFAYRALRFARADETPLPGFDEQTWMPNAEFDHRDLSDLLSEWRSVRGASLTLFSSLSPQAWMRRGVASGNVMSVRALAYTVAGHELHHLNGFA